MEYLPIISVLMPVFNAELYLAAAVESVLAQSFTGFEFIIIDDGSTDGSKRILEEYAARDSRIKLVSRANTGYSVALNEGLGLARGDFIARMDSDDISWPERFEREVEFLLANPAVVVIGGQGVMIDPDGDCLGPLAYNELQHKEIDAQHIVGRGGMIIHSAVMMRTAALRRVGGYRTEFEPAEDLDLWLRMAEIGQLANLAEVVIQYRVHLKSVSHTRSLRQIMMAQRASVEARQRRALAHLTPRPTVVPDASEGAVLRSWVRHAYWVRNYRTARKHATRALLADPRSPSSWWMFCGAWLGAFGRPFYYLTRGKAGVARMP